jgi:outer membrane protein assembly factor BamB
LFFPVALFPGQIFGVANGVVFMGGGDSDATGSIYALNAKTGTLLWTIKSMLQYRSGAVAFAMVPR